MGICEICILTETAKLSLPPEFAKHIPDISPAAAGLRKSDIQSARQADRPEEPFLFLSHDDLLLQALPTCFPTKKSHRMSARQ